MKIIQLNIWQGKLGDGVAKFLNDEQPDIVCLQEVNDMPGDSGGPFNTLEEINNVTHYPHVSKAFTYGYNYMRRTCQFGNAIFSKHPITKEDVTFVRKEYLADFEWEEDDYNVRNIQTCIISTPAGPLTVVNHHGFHDYTPVGNSESVQIMQRVVDHVKKLSGPIIVCGDFNVAPSSPAMKPWEDVPFRNLTSENNVPDTLGSLHRISDVACDYIFVNKPVSVRSFRVIDPQVSDHQALVMEFEL